MKLENEGLLFKKELIGLPTNVYFVRHAHSTYTPDEMGRPLSNKGIADAKIVTELLKSEGIDVVYSSPYKRAIQTVDGIANYLNREVQIIEGFKERKLAEKPVADFEMAITKVWQDFTYSWPGGESNLVAQRRGVAATLQVLDHHQGENVVIGTHGNIMVLIMNYFDKKYGFDFWGTLSMPDIYKLSFRDGKLIAVQRKWQDIKE